MLGWVDRLDELAVDVAEQVMRESGQLQPPAVHLLLDELTQPYLGYVTCRPFYRGEDAAEAVSAMGLVASMVGATRLVVTWENADMWAALRHSAADIAARAVVVVDAVRAGHDHTLRWHPMRLHEGPLSAGGVPTCRPEWGRASHQHRARLVAPIAELLAVWRAPQVWADDELVATYTDMEISGYSMRWVQRLTGEQGQPPWMRLIAAGAS